MAKNYPQLPRILMDFIARGWTIDNKKPAVLAGLLYLFGLTWIVIWWAMRDSNPRPLVPETNALSRLS